MKTVAFVPIRLNSKRVEGKNMRLLAGKPLMQYVLETLLKVQGIDEVYCYCSDDRVVPLLPEGVRFLRRPESLDSDTTLGRDIYNAFVASVEADVYILAHATSPFIKASTIGSALAQVHDAGHDSAFSAEKVQTFAWYGGRPLNYSLTAIPRTQDIEPVFVETSAFYIFRREVWTRLGQRIGNSPYVAVVDKVEGVDIDWPDDFAFAEQVAKLNQGKNTRLLRSTDGRVEVAYADVEQVCMAGSGYALMQYILLFDLDTVLHHTAYFLGYGVSRGTAAHLPAVYISAKQTGRLFTPSRWLEKLRLRLTASRRYPFLRTATLYCQDNGFTPPLIGRRPYALLSDGPRCVSQNMQPGSGEYERNRRKRRSLLGRLEGWLYGPVATATFGSNPQCTAFYMTEENTSPAMEGKPVHVRPLREMWNAAGEAKRAFVRRVFDVGEEDVALLGSRPLMFLTQPMIKDNILTEEEYLSILRDIFSRYDTSQLLLKLHPRDTFDYRRHFPGVAVYDKPVNMQLLVLLGANVERAITICSSSVNAFPESVEVDWYGVGLHPKLRTFFGDHAKPLRPYNQMPAEATVSVEHYKITPPQAR